MIQFFMDNSNQTSVKKSGNLIKGGLISIFLGLLIIFVPEILVAFFSLLFISTGIALFGWGLIIKKNQNQFQQIQFNIEE